MAIEAINVAIKVAPLNAACAGGTFTVTADVHGISKAGGSYDVFVYARKRLWFDTKLDQLLANVVLPAVVPSGKFSAPHIFTLNCDPKCKIAGKLASSGRNPADIYVFASASWNINAASGLRLLTCEEEDEALKTE